MDEMRAVIGKKLVLALVTLVISFAFVGLAGEVVCRMFFPDQQLRYRSDPDALFYFEPNQEGVLLLNNGLLSPPATINRLGLRGPEPPLGKRTILVVGDSFTFGAGVGDQDTFSAQLEAALGKGVSVVNAGQPGYGVFQMEATLRRVASILNPELVIAMIWQGDFLRQPPSDEDKKRLFRQQVLSKILKQSVLVTHTYRMVERLLLRFSGESLVSHVGEGTNENPGVEQILKGLSADESRLIAMHELAKRYGKGLVVVLWPKENFATLPSSEVGLAKQLSERLEQFSLRSGIPFFSVQSVMREGQPSASLLIPGDWHPTPVAHCLAARRILEGIEPLGYHSVIAPSCNKGR